LNRPGLILNLPNVLTLARVLLTPLFIICLIKGSNQGALLVFTLAGVTDGLDGLIARVFNQKTAIGSLLDPLADKFLLISAFVTLAIQDMAPAWLAVVVITREVVLIMIGIVILALSKLPNAIRPSMVSKCTTASQLATIFILLLSTQTAVLEHALLPLYSLTTVLSIVSGLHYVYLGIQIIANTEDGPGSSRD
jgi:cardiolipin synthase